MAETYSNLTTSKDPRLMFNGGLRQRAIDTIVVHHNATMNKQVALNTWTLEANNWTSAHYEITDTEIIGAVGENYVAYHAGGTGGADVPKMSDPNGRSIGLEHVNSSGAPSWGVSDATLRNSARLIADICKRYNLPINRNTIKLHREVTSTACPGGLDIDKLIRYAQEAANASNVPAAKFKVGNQIVLTKNAWATTYGTRFRDSEHNSWGTVKSVKRYDKSNSHWSYEINFSGVIWNVLEQDLLTRPVQKAGGFKVGQTVTLKGSAYKWQTGQVIKDFAKNKQYKIKSVKAVNQSNSKQAVLLEGVISWALAQDVQ